MARATAVLHPGEMGAAVGACLAAHGHRVVWSSEGRSPATRTRAHAAGLADAGSLAQVLAASAVVLSICPPHGALGLARDVAGCGYRGLYVDANAVSPETARRIGETVEAAGATFVDGGIIGPPPGGSGGIGTRLYLAGAAASRVAAPFAGTALEVIVLDGPVGAASALKAAYAGWTKGATALVAAVLALAAREGVSEALGAEWARSQPDLRARVESVRSSARKAWRWVAELEEIGGALGAVGLPEGFGRAAAEVYRRLARYKDAPAPPGIEDVLRSLLASEGARPR